MNEISIKDFDYSLVDGQTAEYLESKTFKINGIAESMRTQIGKELKEVQERLAHNHQGVFAKWYESLGLKKDNVYYWIHVYEYSRNLEDTRQLENFSKAPKSLQIETMKNNKPKELQSKVLEGDIRTHKEFKELESKLKQKDAEIESLKNRESKVIEKEVVKEVKITPPDYEGMKSDMGQLSKALKKTQAELEHARFEAEAATGRNEFIESQHSKMLKSREEVNGQAQEYQDLKESIARMQGKMDKQQKKLKALKRITQLVKESNEYLYQIAPIKYYEEFDILRSNYNVQEEVVELVERTEQWCGEMRQLLNTDILEGEIIND